LLKIVVDPNKGEEEGAVNEKKLKKSSDLHSLLLLRSVHIMRRESVSLTSSLERGFCVKNEEKTRPILLYYGSTEPVRSMDGSYPI
jgi:hypothetical protein